MSLQTRLVLLQALLLAAGLVAFAGLVAARFEAALLHDVDEALEPRAAAVAADVRSTSEARGLGPLRVEPGPLEEMSRPGIYVQVRSLDGQVLASSANLAGGDLPAPPTLGAPATVPVQRGERLRVLSVQAEQDGRPIAIVRVGESLHLVDASVRQLTGLLLGIGSGVLALTVLLTWLAVRHALTPLGAITAAAEAVARTGDAERRAPGAGRRDEVGRLARAFNEMAARLWKLLEMQRQLLADTSHELRNPLTVIRTNLGLLRKDLPADTREEIAAETDEEAIRMSRMVDDLLLLGEVQERTPPASQLVRLDRLARDVAQQYAARGTHQVLVEANEPLAIRADRDRLRQVLVNLLDNATRHTPAGGVIRVSVRRLGSEAELAVADTGPGIAAEHLPRLFDRFYRVEPARDRQTGGSGLGLSIVKHIAETYGGRVRAESTPGEGARFIMTFPVEPSWRLDAGV